MDGGTCPNVSEMEQEVSESAEKSLSNGVNPESPALGVSGAKPISNGGNTVNIEGADGSSPEKDSFSGSMEGGYTPQTTLTEQEGSEADRTEDKKVTMVSMVQARSSARRQPSQPPVISKPRTPYQPRQQRVTPVKYYGYMPMTQQQLFYTPAPTTGYIPQQSRSQTQLGDQLSSTNLYIRGLSQRCTDEDLVKMCQQYGKIVSTKAILDKQTNLCKGYGFVDFESPADALKAVQALQLNGVMAQFAKVPQLQEQDPTNLYMSNLPRTFEEKNLETLLLQHVPCMTIISTRILRDQNGFSRGVGFARLDSKENCEKAIEILSGMTLAGSSEPLMVKFADSGSSKKKQQNQGRWRDVMEQYMYEAPHIMSQNGLVNSRGLVQQGVLATPYMQTATHPISGYQVPVSTAVSSGTWQQAYFMQPTNPLGGSNSVEGVHGLATQMGQLQISTTNAFSPQPQHTTQYQITTPHGGTQYAQQTPGGWTISQHPIPNTPLLQQDRSTEHQSVAESKAHHVQVITPEHSAQVSDPTHTLHVYYPNSTWTGK